MSAVLKDEIDILYAALNKLTNATTPAELLEAVSDYARAQGATSGLLTYTYGSETQVVEWGEVIAEWTVNGAKPTGIGRRFDSSAVDFLAEQGISFNPDEPLLVGDAPHDVHINPPTRQWLLDSGIASLAILVLKHHSRWLGVISFGWTQPYRFSERDRRIYTALIQQAAPVVDSSRLYEGSRDRASRAELMLKLNTALSKATDETSILDAVAPYAETQGADRLVLSFVDVDQDIQSLQSRFVAIWENGRSMPYEAYTGHIQSFSPYGIAELWTSQPNQILYVENIATDERVSAANRSAILKQFQMRAMALIPLFSSGRYQGVLTVIWFTPHHFSEEEFYIYPRLQQTLPAVVATRRAYLAEQEARRENEALRHRAERLAEINSQLLRAADEIAILNALVPYVQSRGATGMLLTYVDANDDHRLTAYRWVALWRDGEFYLPGQMSMLTSDDELNAEFDREWMRDPQQSFLSENIIDDERLRPEMRQRWATIRRSRGVAVLPLYGGGRYQASLMIAWYESHPFSDDERFIFNQLLQTLPSAVATRRAYLAEQDARRDNENMRRRAETLARINSDLLQAVDEETILRALVPYAQAHGAQALVLSYIDSQDDRLTYVQSTQWMAGKVEPFPLLEQEGLRGKLGQAIDSLWLAQPDEVMFSSALLDEPTWTPDVREAWEKDRLTRAAAVLPLYSGGRCIGSMSLAWFEPHDFSEEERYIYSQLMRTLPSFVATRRAYLAEQEARRDNETMRRRAETLARITSDLLRTTDEAGILQALVQYVEAQGAESMVLGYIDVVNDQIKYVQVVQWLDGRVEDFPMIPGQDRRGRLGEALEQLWLATPDQVMFSANLLTDERLPLEIRQAWEGERRSRAVAIIPLYSGERCIGSLAIAWFTPHEFSEEERYIYAQLMRTVPSFAASRRAYLSEQEAREESQYLYEVGEAINAATTFQEIINAVSSTLPFGSGDFYLNIFENFDYVGARYFEFVASTSNQFGQDGLRWYLDEFPLVRQYPQQGVFVNENIAENPELDEQSRQRFLDLGVQSNLRVSLSLNGRWMGGLGVDDPTPKRYTAREKRLMDGVGDLAAAAVDRIRLRLETEMLRQRAETLARLNGELLKAGDENAMLSAIGPYAQKEGAAGILLYYIDTDGGGQPFNWQPIALWLDGAPVQNWQPLLVPSHPLDDEMEAALVDEPYGLLLIEDMTTDERFSPAKRESWIATHQTRALAVLLLKRGTQYQGALWIMWFEPHRFSAEEKTIYGNLLQTLPSGVATRRAYLAEQEAKYANQLMRQRAETLARINGELLRAVDENGILQALVPYIEAQGAFAMSLFYFVGDDPYDSCNIHTVATWREGRFVPQDQLPTPNRSSLRIDDHIQQLLFREPDRIHLIEDIAGDTRWSEDERSEWLAQRLTRATAEMLLVSGGRYQGNLVIMWDNPHVFSEDEQSIYNRLLETVPSVVATRRAYLAVQEAQRLNESSRHQAELLAKVNAALSQAGDEQDILMSVSRLAEQNAADLSILAYVMSAEGNPIDRVNIVAMRAAGSHIPLALNAMPTISFRIDDYPLLRLVENNPGEPVFVENVHTDPRTVSGNTREFAARVEWGAAIMLPMKTGHQWQGTLTFVWKQPTVFPLALRALFSAIHPTITAVVARRRAYVAEQQRAHELQTVAKVSAAASSVLDEMKLLEQIAELTAVNFRQYHFAIFLLEGDTLLQSTGFDRGQTPLLIALNNHRSLIAKAAHTREGEFVPDMMTSTAFDLVPLMSNARSELAVPMTVADRLIGVLDVQSKEVNRFSEADMWVMATMADLIAVAIQNARLYQQAQELAAFEERNRLARELHDSVSQALYGIALGARTARKTMDIDPTKLAAPLDYVLSLAEAGLTEMRALIFDLRPGSLEEEGLVSALTKQTASIQARHAIKVTTDFCAEPGLPLNAKEMLYWIAREALHNIMKHAQATAITVRVMDVQSCIEMEISDNGLGFDPDGSFPGHLGLHTMRERAARLHGTLELESAPGAGTTIRVRVPYLLARA